MSPQYGHIICNRTSLAGAAMIARAFFKKSKNAASRLRNPFCAERKTGSIDFPPFLIDMHVYCFIEEVTPKITEQDSA
jgi:hypothetical protein